MAGNVCTPEMVQELILHGGVDIVKIGIKWEVLAPQD